MCIARRLEQSVVYVMSEYKLYLKLLAAGETYAIFISKRLLLRTVLPFWVLLFAIFMIPNLVFFAMVGIPSLILFAIYLVDLYHCWKACNISKSAYTVFHVSAILILRIITAILIELLEAIWILCF